MNINEKSVGFFDSGIGGLSVLKEAIKILPSENYVYFGDSGNAPYGTKSLQQVKALTFNAIEFLLEKNCKAVVVACNTATSAAIDDLRAQYCNIPIIGIEPALKPAVELNRKGKIIIMATPMTLAETKFNRLMKKYNEKAEIQPLPCAGLVEMIEKGILEGKELEDYLRVRLDPFINDGIAAIVLGCTHYPFIKRSLGNIVGADIPLIDGSKGTAYQLKTRLNKFKLKNGAVDKGRIEIYNSIEDKNIVLFSHDLLSRKL